jgi:hypothetical protein
VHRPSPVRPYRHALIAVAGIAALGAVAAAPAGAEPSEGHPAPAAYEATIIASGSSLHHTFEPTGRSASAVEPLTKPDDITRLGDTLLVGFQNGVGPQGEPSTDGNTDSTIVQLTLTGRVLGQWDVTGKADGVTADPALHGVVVTVNEDANSSLYLVQPGATAAVTHYTYDQPLAHQGGTDAISVYQGKLLVTASAPGTTGAPAPQPTYPAVYSVELHPKTGTASVTPVFSDEDQARVATVDTPQSGKTTALALTDPDSSAVVPWAAPRFGGDFMLTSQGDLQQIYVSRAGGEDQHLSVLSLSQAVDDTAWVSKEDGALYATDSTHDTVAAVTGRFHDGQALVAATPCGSNSAPAICPAPPAYPTNYLGTLNPWTGQVSAVTVGGQPFVPQGGLVFVPNEER